MIDYTGSNGPITDRRGLHFYQEGRPNEYMSALNSVGNIIAPYDHSGMFPLYGFGAIPSFMPEIKVTNFCFPLTGDFNQP
jgi:hypothetical protein